MRSSMNAVSVGVMVLGIGLAASVGANASDLLFDRGLPTANLNNAADSNRSNVQWADAQSISSDLYLPGDDFTLSGTGAYNVSTIRVWSTDNVGLSLKGGLAGGSISALSNTYTGTDVTASYDGGIGHQGTSGEYSSVYQIDFAVNIALSGGETYQFFLDVLPAIAYGSDYRNAFLHASNADLSGSTQQGADNTFLWLAPEGNVVTWLSTGGGTSEWGAGWDKNSDGNVQVFGSAVPEPGTIVLLTMAGLGLLAYAWRRRRS